MFPKCWCSNIVVSFLPVAAEEAVAEKAKPVVLPYTGLPSLDNIPSVAGLMAEMAAKKDEKRKLEEEKKLEERRVRQTS